MDRTSFETDNFDFMERDPGKVRFRDSGSTLSSTSLSQLSHLLTTICTPHDLTRCPSAKSRPPLGRPRQPLASPRLLPPALLALSPHSNQAKLRSAINRSSQKPSTPPPYLRSSNATFSLPSIALLPRMRIWLLLKAMILCG